MLIQHWSSDWRPHLSSIPWAHVVEEENIEATIVLCRLWWNKHDHPSNKNALREPWGDAETKAQTPQDSATRENPLGSPALQLLRRLQCLRPGYVATSGIRPTCTAGPAWATEGLLRTRTLPTVGRARGLPGPQPFCHQGNQSHLYSAVCSRKAKRWRFFCFCCYLIQDNICMKKISISAGGNAK